MPRPLTESVVEEAALQWLEELGYSILPGPEIEPEGLRQERASFGDVTLIERLRAALARINPGIPEDAREEAIRKLQRVEHPDLVENNRRFHRFLIDGVPVEYQAEGRTKHDQVWLVDFDHPENNDWLAVNQFTVMEERNHRRPDIAVFVNGLPLTVIELKDPTDPQATIQSAFKQLLTYKAEIPALFACNEVLVASDGTKARAGTLTSEWGRFMPWRTVEGKDLSPKELPQLEVLLKGIFEKQRFLELIRDFIVFEAARSGLSKKLAGYHQFHAVRKAIESTVKAVKGDRRVGIVWHTQGSGKSLTMAFYAGKVIRHPAMENPTLVILTDRNDLDDQLYQTFAGCKDLLRQTPAQSESRSHLRELLQVASGGVVFTTIQKFLPEEREDRFPKLSDRRNIVVIADEAHRSQYEFVEGFARHMRDALPNASFIGFTATPIEMADRNTRTVFGDYIDVYDVHQAIDDEVTVPIQYEPRLAKLELSEEERPRIDPEFEEVTEDQEESARSRLRSRWARLEALVGAEKRIHQVAKDIVEHFEQRLGVMDGKGLIVCMSRRICVDLYNAIIKLRPQWHHPDDDKGFLKVVMTGHASDGPEWQQHSRNKERRRALGDGFKDPDNPIKLVIVRDMWLTGFDVPSLHTMYVDKPMRRHGLMQAIARVNRVFKDKPGGRVVDYLGIAHELKKALAEYSEKDRKETGVSLDEAVAVLLEKYEVLKAMFYKFDYSAFFRRSPQERVRIIPAAMEHILALEDGKKRFLKTVAELSKAFALSVPHEKALAIQDEVGFFQAVRVAIVKNTGINGPGPSREDLDSAIQQIVSKAVSSDQVVDIFSAAGLKKPDISILSEVFLQELRGMPYKNLAVETLQKLLNDEIKVIQRRFLVQSKSFALMLEESIRKYHNRAIEAAQVVEELIRLAREMREAHRRGEKLGLAEEELAFYDALETNDSAVKVLGDNTLRTIARELVETVRHNLSIDWTVRESVKANLRRLVRRVLRQHGYPPDKQEKATQTVLEQMELFSEWSVKEPTSQPALEIVSIAEAQPYVTHLPVHSLKAAAGKFGDGQHVEEEGWVRVDGRKLDKEMFVAQVVGRSMEPRIPDGSYCIFRWYQGGTRQGKIVLTQYHGPADPDTGGSFTVKQYESDKFHNPDETWEHAKIALKPLNPAYQPIEIKPTDAESVKILAEFLEVLGST
ncbi:MAG: DEAD/DEAH box helicase [Candidatus Omnitrophica bacterium CG11_big_fil_rev_8_21_14_0_20_64_10]|nr:MAG: DEAD/DEAH box helicase [Candidatus Omnitrophica bacterium CG11_big_fil_rev_8_21_14_0_20_64_10]